jgi:hypothetical protein
MWSSTLDTTKAIPSRDMAFVAFSCTLQSKTYVRHPTLSDGKLFA